MDDLARQVKDIFTGIKVKPPFSTAPGLMIYEPTDHEVREVVFRLREVWTDDDLDAMDKMELSKAIKRVWELVRWLNYD